MNIRDKIESRVGKIFDSLMDSNSKKRINIVKFLRWIELDALTYVWVCLTLIIGLIYFVADGGKDEGSLYAMLEKILQCSPSSFDKQRNKRAEQILRITFIPTFIFFLFFEIIRARSYKETGGE